MPQRRCISRRNEVEARSTSISASLEGSVVCQAGTVCERSLGAALLCCVVQGRLHGAAQLDLCVKRAGGAHAYYCRLAFAVLLPWMRHVCAQVVPVTPLTSNPHQTVHVFYIDDTPHAQ